MKRSARPRLFSRLSVRPRPGNRAQGWLAAGAQRIPVALGRAGIKANKREGDGGTPRGCFHPVRIWWRADRGPRPITSLPIRYIGPTDAWCENPADRRYNRPFALVPGKLARDISADLGYTRDRYHAPNQKVRARTADKFTQSAQAGLLSAKPVPTPDQVRGRLFAERALTDRLWRDDYLYDLIVEIDHNTRPRIAGRGSAVFIHIARPGLAPTAGCVALPGARLRWLIAHIGRKTKIIIQ